MFSALTMFRWGRLAFGSPVKALGFVVLAEGVMTFCSTAWLSVVALGYLVLINAIREAMTEKDVECTLQRAHELDPNEKPRVISDNGPQFIAKDFKEFIGSPA